MHSELDNAPMSETVIFQLRVQKEQAHQTEGQLSNCYEVWMLLLGLEKVQSNLSVKGKSIKCD